MINFYCPFGPPPLILSLACDTILIISQEALFCCPHRLHLFHSPQHSWGIRLFIKEKDTKGAVGNTVNYSSFTVVVCSVFLNIDDFVTGVKFFSLSVSHFISDIFTIPIQLTIIKNGRLPAKARNHIHLHQGDMTEK